MAILRPRPCAARIVLSESAARATGRPQAVSYDVCPQVRRPAGSVPSADLHTDAMTVPTARPWSPRDARVLAMMVMAALLVGLAPHPTARAGLTAASQVEAPEGVWPLDPEPSVLAPFAPPPDPWGAGHRGVDLEGSPGQVVRSALPGKVGFAGSVAGKPVVTVLHGGRRTTYEPVVAGLEPGAPVAAGDPIGRLVLSASHCFPAACLHWGLRRGEDYLDPLSLVGGGPVRLLPLWRDVPATSGDQALEWLSALSVWRPAIDVVLRRAGEPDDRPGAGGRS